MGMRYRVIFCLVLFVSFGVVLRAQEPSSQDDQAHIKPRNPPEDQKPRKQQKPEEAAQPQGESSSKDSQINLNLAQPSNSGSSTSDDLQELRPFDPHKAAKDIEVGEYYLKHKNYRAALDRFNEALLYKPNDAEATFHLAETQEKLDLFTKSYQNYSRYLEILPNGPLAKDAQEALKRLDSKVEVQDAAPDQRHALDLQVLIQQGETALAKNDFETAYDRFSRALQIAPDNALTNFHLAESLQGMQRLDEARLFYQKCVKLQPDGPQVREAKRQIAEINYVLGK